MSRLAFITGASSGIGQALALRCSQRGYRLALVARRAAETKRWACTAGIDPGRCTVHAADVADPGQIGSAAQRCLDSQGLPDVVIANAGISIGVDPSEAQDIGVVAQLLATNVTGLAATLQPFIGPMRERGHGRLVGVASVAGIRGLPGHAGYCASKAAVLAYCESLRAELAPTGVRVVTLVPGYIDTPLTRRNRYPMPFLMPADRFAAQALAAIEAGQRYRVLPWQMALVARLLRGLPDALFDRLVQGQPRKARQIQE